MALLTNLPTEILHMIADQADAEDVMALSLTSTRLKAVFGCWFTNNCRRYTLRLELLPDGIPSDQSQFEKVWYRQMRFLVALARYRSFAELWRVADVDFVGPEASKERLVIDQLPSTALLSTIQQAILSNSQSLTVQRSSSMSLQSQDMLNLTISMLVLLPNLEYLFVHFLSGAGRAAFTTFIPSTGVFRELQHVVLDQKVPFLISIPISKAPELPKLLSWTETHIIDEDYDLRATEVSTRIDPALPLKRNGLVHFSMPTDQTLLLFGFDETSRCLAGARMETAGPRPSLQTSALGVTIPRNSFLTIQNYSNFQTLRMLRVDVTRLVDPTNLSNTQLSSKLPLQTLEQIVLHGVFNPTQPVMVFDTVIYTNIGELLRAATGQALKSIFICMDCSEASPGHSMSQINQMLDSDLWRSMADAGHTRGIQILPTTFDTDFHP